MSVLGISAAGAIIGAGVAIFISGMKRPAPKLRPVVQPSFTIADMDASSDHQQTLRDRISGSSIGTYSIYQNLRTDLRVVSKTIEEVVLQQLAGALAALMLVVFVTVLLAPPLYITILLVAVALVAAFILPLQRIKDEAEEIRTQAAMALSYYVLLASVSIQSGSTVHGSFYNVSTIGSGWIWKELQGAIQKANQANLPINQVFDDLGKELVLPELEQLSRSLQLTEQHGTPIVATIRSEAENMREDQAAKAKAADDRITELMVFPAMALFASLVAFIGIGALAAIFRTAQSL